MELPLASQSKDLMAIFLYLPQAYIFAFALEAESHHVAQAGFKLNPLASQEECGAFRCESPCLVYVHWATSISPSF